MKICVVGTDSSALDATSALADRIGVYAQHVDAYTVIVPAKKQTRTEIAENAVVVGAAGGNKVLQLLAMRCELKRVVVKGVDVISAQDPFYTGWVAVAVGALYKVGVEVQVHGWERMSWFKKQLAKMVLSRASVVRTVSRRMAQELQSDFGVEPSKLVIVPIATELEKHSPKEYVNNGALQIVSVGRLVPVKRFDLLLRACALLHIDWTLRIVGDGPELDSLKTVAKELGVVDKVTFVGRLSYSQLQFEYKNADVFALASDAEGWGLVAIEAASHGLPVVMTDVGCAGEVIRDGQEGIVVPVGDDVALSQAIESLQDVGRRRVLGTAAHAMALSLPNMQETIARYVQSWEKAKK